MYKMKYFPGQALIAFSAFLSIPFAFALNAPIHTTAETPASLACIYGLTPTVLGCPIIGTTIIPQGGSGIIAVIEGGDDPDALGELTQFSLQFMPNNVLPQCTVPPTPNVPCFQTYYAPNATT